MRHILAAVLVSTAALHAEQVVFTEVMYSPPAGKPEFVEILNLTSNRLDMAQWRLKDAVEFTFPAFAGGSAHFLNEYERIIVSSANEATTRAAYPTLPVGVRVFGPWTGSLNNAGDHIVLNDGAGARVCNLDYGDSGKWPRAADGTGHSIVVVNQNRKIDDWGNWRLSLKNGGSPGYAEPSGQDAYAGSPELAGPSVTAINYGDSWKYFTPVSDPGTTWRDLGFAETGWSGPGPGLLGFETAPLPSPGLQTTFGASGPITYLFRKTFTFSGNPTGATFAIDQIVDDGAYYYLNGVPLGGLGWTAGGAWNSAANRVVSDATEELNAVTGALPSLVNGTNVLAVQVHQNSTGSSDMVFGAKLRIASLATVAINEVKPGTAGNGFVEFYNATGSALDLQGYYLSDTPGNLTKYLIPSSLVVPAGGLATIGYAESNLAVASPVIVYLTAPNGTTVVNAINANMILDGRSLGRQPVGGATWYYFSLPTPGAPNSGTVAFRLSEAHFGASGVDWVEFANTSSTAVSGAGYFVASLADFSDKVALPGTIAANGFANVAVNFPTDGGGDVTLYLIDSANNVVDSAALDRQPGLDSVQRFPISGSEWFNAATATQDAANAPAIHDEIVVNEIMHAPMSRHDQAQFIELHNKSGGVVNLTGWRLVDGLTFDFAPGTTLAAGAYLIVAKDPAYITANYPGVTNVVGPAGGGLRRNGERIRLEDERRNLADLVDYRTGGEWPADSGGKGSSLELINPQMDNSRPSAWRASDESSKGTFQTYSVTGLYRELRGIPTGNVADSRELLLNLVADGHIVMRNISFAAMTAPGTNLLTTGTATSHTGNSNAGFHCTGTHAMSDTLADGFHLISTGAGDTKANKAEVDIPTMTGGSSYTFSFEARWVSGMPLLVAQTWDRSMGKVFRLNVPNNLGTPGVANSRFNAAPAPTVDSLAHSPKVPTSSQPVVVTTRVSSASPISTVTLFHKTDAGGAAETYTPLAMNDSGTAGDAIIGDGIWTATIAAKGDGSITQFYVSASASNGQTNDLPRTPLGIAAVNGSVLRVPARPAMYIVDNSPPSAVPGILTERYIVSLYDRASLDTGTGFSTNRDWDYPRMSNFGHNATIIFNESDVFYNCEMRKGGSPWTRDGGNGMSRIRYRPPEDNQWRGRSKSGIDNDAGGGNRFHNRTVRYMLYTLGQPIPDSEFCQRIVNADGPGLGDDQEQTDDDFFDRVHPGGDGGELFEIDDAWFMYDSNNMDDRVDAGSVTGRWALGDWANASITAPSDESPIFFHGNWPLRFPEERYDYAALAQFIKTAYNNNTDINTQTQLTQDTWREQMGRMIDVDHAAAYAAARGYIGDWDNFTLHRGKNGYFYRRPSDKKFEFHHWDSDIGFDQGTAVIGATGGTGWTNLANAPYFRRALHFYLSKLQTDVNGGTSRVGAFMTAMNYQSANPDGNAPFKTNQFDYMAWFATRSATITNTINSYGGFNNTTRPATVTNTSGTTTGAGLLTLTGEAPAHVWAVDVLGHPEGVFAWTGNSTNIGLWSLSNISLANGLNSLTVRFLAKDGTVITTLPFTITFTGNGQPIARLVMDPSSGNVARNEALILSGGTSTDPENGALTFAWSVTPATGAVLTPAGSNATVVFTQPGSYTVTMSATDPAFSSGSTSRAITVSNADDFVPFSSQTLPAGFTATNVEYRDNYSLNTWYSLEDNSGRIIIQITDEAGRPLGAPSGTFPRITRDLPDSVDFILQTDVAPLTREFGAWQAGLWFEMIESGIAVRYTLDLDSGLNLRVRRAPHPSSFSQSATIAVTGSGATIRARRTGNLLFFERKLSTGLWSTVHTQALPAGSTANTGGIFSATSAPTSSLIAFDYLLVADSSVTTDFINNLRITEVMYSPGTVDNVEYIELRNIGTAPLNLQNCRFANNDPFDEFIFPTFVLPPGGYAIVANSSANFTTRYGALSALAGQWGTASGLNNSGENIRLLDPDLNEIHNFSYAAIAPWPITANGTGRSIEVISTAGNYDLGTNWRASFESNGSPGYAGIGPDTDGDGQHDSQELLFGTNPNDPGSRFSALLTNGANVAIGFPSVNGRQYRVEYRDSLTTGAWQTLQTITATGPVTNITDTTTPKPAVRFYRVLAL